MGFLDDVKRKIGWTETKAVALSDPGIYDLFGIR